MDSPLVGGCFSYETFSLSWGFLFVLFCVLFFFFSLHSEVDPERSCYDLCQSVLPVFSSEGFRVSGLTFRSLIHSEFISVYGVREHSLQCLTYVPV